MSMDVILPIVVFNNVDLSTSQVSAGIRVQFTDNIGIQFVWTGAPFGTFGVDVSNDATFNQSGLVSDGDWTPMVLTSPQPPVAAGTSGNGSISLTQLPFAFMRVTYTAVSGTGNCTAKLTSKPV